MSMILALLGIGLAILMFRLGANRLCKKHRDEKQNVGKRVKMRMC